MSANDKQVGGSHYKKGGEQHWDLMITYEVPYTLGCATKYLFRWKDKNGIQDLTKALHYLEKTIECRLKGVIHDWLAYKIPRTSLAKNIPPYVEERERQIILKICDNKLGEAVILLQHMIAHETVLLKA